MTVEFSEFKGNKMIKLVSETDAEGKWPFSFGKGKAKLIVANANKKPEVTRIKVTVNVVGNSIEITVEDNGSKLSEPVTPGLGLTLFDIYSSNFGGRFSLENSQDGVVMRMVLMFTPVSVKDLVAQKKAGTISE